MLRKEEKTSVIEANRLHEHDNRLLLRFRLLFSLRESTSSPNTSRFTRRITTPAVVF